VNQVTTEAIILRRTNYGEADRIINFLTPNHGVVSAIAKGVRKSKSKLAGGLEIFAVTDITLISGKSDLSIVSSARMRDFYKNLLSEYERMQLGYEYIKQVSTATSSVSEPEFYALLKNAFEWLNDLSIDWRLSEICFRLRMAQLLGHGLNLKYDITGTRLSAENRYNYDVGESGFVLSNNGRFSADEIKFLRLATVKSPQVLKQISGLEGVLEDSLWLSRVVGQI
jgi:DNA repair protein RecO